MKKLMMMVAVAAMSFGAQADLLYFLVDGYTPQGPTKNFDYTMVGVAKNVGGTGWTTTWGDNESKVYLQVQATKDGGWGGFVDADNSGVYSKAGPSYANIIDDYKTSEYKFYIETYADGGSGPIWGFDESTALGYTALLEQKHIYTDSTAAQDVTPWIIPEPTSGMLALFGCALLALRRRRDALVASDRGC